MIDPRTLLTIRNSSADGPSPAMLELRGKRYVVADEVTTISPEVIKVCFPRLPAPRAHHY